jgi:hypothetical protein
MEPTLSHSANGADKTYGHIGEINSAGEFYFLIHYICTREGGEKNLSKKNPHLIITCTKCHVFDCCITVSEKCDEVLFVLQ